MKSFSKFCLMLAGVFVVLGIVGVTAGIALGAKPSQFLHMVHYRNIGWPWWHSHAYLVEDWEDEAEDWRQEAQDWRDDLDDLDDLGGDGEGIGSWGYELSQHWKDYDVDQIVGAMGITADSFDSVFGDADTTKLNLELSQAVLKLYTHDGAGIRIRGANARSYLKIVDNDGVLTLTDHRKSKEKAVVLEIYLPKGKMEKLDLDLGGCLFYAKDLEAEKIDIDMGAGETEIDAIRAEKLDLDMGAGIFVVEEIAVDEKASLEVGTGEMEVNRFSGGDLSLECGVGAISITAVGKEGDYNYELSCGIGSLDLNGKDYSGLGREKTIDNQASKKIRMECGIGAIDLQFED